MVAVIPCVYDMQVGVQFYTKNVESNTVIQELQREGFS